MSDIKRAEIGFAERLHNVKKLVGIPGLWEIRSSLTSGRNARMLFCINKNRLVILHGFIKKSQKTPKNHIAVAQSRMKGLK